MGTNRRLWSDSEVSPPRESKTAWNRLIPEQVCRPDEKQWKQENVTKAASRPKKNKASQPQRSNREDRAQLKDQHAR